MKRYIVAGIGTDVGKTVAAAVLTEMLDGTYWKPVQAGDLDHSDTFKVQHLGGPECYIRPEYFRLKTAASPHLAAEIDGVRIALEDLELPLLRDNESLVIETAGGLMVPLNDEGLLYIDVMKHWGFPVMLVTRHYLGSINHTLLSLYALKARNIPVAGLIVNGHEHEPSERIYKAHFPEIPHIRLPELDEVSASHIWKIAAQWKKQLG
jgi:dethiobiotin synthetase